MEMMGVLDVGEASDHEQPDSQPFVQRARLDHFFSNWKSVIPTIIRPYLEYLSETLGKPVTRHISPLSACSRVCSDKRSTNITCLYFDCESLLFYFLYAVI